MSIIQYGSRPLFSPAKIYLIGDVHNEADKLMCILDQIEPLLKEEDHIVFCGDIVDRGSQPALTIETLVDLCRRRPKQVIFIEGNHEEMLRIYVAQNRPDWMRFIGPTLEGLKTSWNLPDITQPTIAQALADHGYGEITSRTVQYYETADIIATHAPIDFMMANMNGVRTYQADFQNKAALPKFSYLLDRLDYRWQFTEENRDIPEIDKFRVCGHQAGSFTHPRIFKDRAFIDTGCGLRPNGKLTCLVYPGKKFYQSKV
jgi:hypothetical protein